MCEISHIFAIIKKTNIGKNYLVKKKIKTKGRIRIRLLVLNATISITCTVYCSSRIGGGNNKKKSTVSCIDNIIFYLLEGL